MKALLLLSAILAITACLPVPEDQEREKRSASDELPERISFPPFGPPFGGYPPFFNQGNPWYYYYYYNPFLVPIIPPTTRTP
ncbi:follicular dendritic cell secreted peptide isoform X1 [Rattus norvegicus]|uniref:Follicular dendritic cell secreted peptide n=1 Tax=Rattus norvegicus TaxID=10116 RepID=Q5R1M6_RAT|nr:follicular dendritic cell secreted peptide precursor [Rattus norvegicus]BAD77806.1 follicular dendritic cell secreted peptide [Rattus norvegicus]|eukprot:NP_001009505.1 follicular dendritic cell secreted peptide precursor [Rattus norvegicus]